MHQAKHEESASHDRTEIPSTSTYRRPEDASLITGPAFDRRFPRGSEATNIAAKDRHLPPKIVVFRSRLHSLPRNSGVVQTSTDTEMSQVPCTELHSAQ